MIDALITDLEHQLDRSKLYSDPLSGPSLDAALYRWIKALREINDTHHTAEELEAAKVEACLEHDSEIKLLCEAVADFEDRIRQVKEIL